MPVEPGLYCSRLHKESDIGLDGLDRWKFGTGWDLDCGPVDANKTTLIAWTRQRRNLRDLEFFEDDVPAISELLVDGYACSHVQAVDAECVFWERIILEIHHRSSVRT